MKDFSLLPLDENNGARELRLNLNMSLIHKELQELHNRTLNHFNITFRQVMVLVYLALHPDEVVTQRTLETAMSLSNPTVTVLVRTMRDKGLITREQCVSDKRQFRLHMTDKAREILPQCHLEGIAIDRMAYEGVTQEEMETVRRVYEKIKKNLGNEADEEKIFHMCMENKL